MIIETKIEDIMMELFTDKDITKVFITVKDKIRFYENTIQELKNENESLELELQDSKW